MISAILGEFWPYIAGVGATLIGLAVAYLKGRGDQKERDVMENAYDYQETRERMDKIRRGDDLDAVVDSLRKRAGRGSVQRDGSSKD